MVFQGGFEPSFWSQRYDEGWELAGVGLTYDRGQAWTVLDRIPAPLEAIMGERADGESVPRDQEIECRFILGGDGAGAMQQELLAALALPLPPVLACERPYGIARGLGIAVLLDEACCKRPAHARVEGGRVFATQVEDLWEALPHGGDRDTELAECVGQWRSPAKVWAVPGSG